MKPDMESPDSRLIERVANGDGKAYEAIVERYEKIVFNVAYRMTKDCDDAMDITQAVFVRAYEKLDTFDPSRKLFSWLYKIAVNQSLNHIKRRNRDVEFRSEFGRAQVPPDDRADGSEAGEEIQNALMALKLDHRIVIVLKYFLELTYKEIGDIVEIPEKTVKSRLFTARQQLRDILTASGYTR